MAILLAVMMVVVLVSCGNSDSEIQDESNSSNDTSSDVSNEVTDGNSKDDSEDTSGETEVIKYWYPWGGDSETWDLWRIEQFEENNPGYKIDPTYVPPDAGITNGKLLAAIAAQDVPDVICAPNTLTYPLATQGAFEDITEYMQELDRTPDDYQPSVQDLMDIGGKWYIMPMETDTQMLFINKEKAESAGLDPSNPPKTISELDSWAKKMTVTDGSDFETMGFIPWIDGGDDVYNWAWYFGAPLYEDGKLNITDPDFQKVFDWQATYAEKYDPERIKSFTSGFGGAFSPDHAFFTGKVAMTMNGNWFNNAIKQYAQDLEFVLVPVPVNDDHPELYGGSVLNVNTYCVPKGAENPAAACKFVDYIANAYIADDNNKTWYSTPTRKDVIDDLTLVKEDDPQYSVIKDMVFSEHSNTPALVSIRSVMQQELVSLRDQVLYEGKEAKNLLEELQTKMEEELKKAE